MNLRNLIPGLLRASAEKPLKLNFTAPVDFAAATGEGKRPTFKITAYTGIPMNLSAYYLPLVLDLAGVKASRPKLPILLNHDLEKPIGQADTIRIDANGVYLEGTITADDANAAQVVSNAKNGFEWQASIGASVQRRELLEAGKTTKVNGKDVTGPMLIARESTLIETSFVSIGADQSTSATVAAKSIGDTDMNWNEWLKAKGIDSFDALSEPVRITLKAAYDAEVASAAEKPGDKKTETASINVAASAAQQMPDVAKIVNDAVTAAVSEITKKQEHSAAIMRATARHPELQAKALAENWSVDKAELEVIRASRPAIGDMYVNSGKGQNDIAPDAVLTAALCQAGNLAGADKMFEDKVLQAAHTRFRGRIGIKQMMLEAAWAGGYNGSHFDQSLGGMRDILRAAFSTVSIPGILSNVANKFLLAGFMGVESGWREISAIRPVNDFKAVTSYRLTGAMTFEPVGPDGELKHAGVDEESFTNQARTYGIMHAITRVNIINDDLGALTNIPQKIGRGGALALNDAFWTEFLADHATFFPTNASKKNYISGATTVPSIAGLDAAVTKFMRQTDPDGKPLGLKPYRIVCPPEQLSAWLEINKSTSVNTGGSSTTDKVANTNIFAGRFPPVESSYLSSTLEWYLLANPMDVAMIEVAFLNNVQQPIVETADVDFNTLGIQMRGYWDFGVAKQDYRAAVKSKGAA